MLFAESRAVDEDSDLIYKNVNQKSFDPSEIYHLEANMLPSTEFGV